MDCASCGAVIDPGDRFCPACCLPNIGGIHHPRFGPPEREPGPMLVARVVEPGRRPCPRCGDGIRASDHYCRSCGIEVASLTPLPPPGRTVGVWNGPGPHGDDWYHPMAVLTAGPAPGARRGGAGLGRRWWPTACWWTRPSEAGCRCWGRGVPRPNWAELQSWIGQPGRPAAGADRPGHGAGHRLDPAGLPQPGAAQRGRPAVQARGGRCWAGSSPASTWWCPSRSSTTPGGPRTRRCPPTPRGRRAGGARRRRPPTSCGGSAPWSGSRVVVLTELQLSLAGTLPPTTTAGIHDARMGYLLLAGSQALLVFAAILLIRLLGAIYERQRDRADAIGPVAPIRPLAAADQATGGDATAARARRSRSRCSCTPSTPRPSGATDNLLGPLVGRPPAGRLRHPRVIGPAARPGGLAFQEPDISPVECRRARDARGRAVPPAGRHHAGIDRSWVSTRPTRGSSSAAWTRPRWPAPWWAGRSMRPAGSASSCCSTWPTDPPWASGSG